MSVLAAVGWVVIVAVHTVVAAVATRYFRVTLDATWTRALYVVLFVPLALVVSTLVLSGAFGFGGDLGREVALLLAIVLPLALGVAIDSFWMLAPAEVELPESS